MDIRTISIILCILYTISIPMLLICYYYDQVKKNGTNIDGVRFLGLQLKYVTGIFCIIALISIFGIQIIFLHYLPGGGGFALLSWPRYLIVIMSIGLLLIVSGRLIGPIMRKVSPSSRFSDRKFSLLIEGILRLVGGYLIIMGIFLWELQPIL